MAPLGTALTEDQIKLLWRLAPEPVLCFDGDGAGRRAAFRAVETVLPHLKPGFSVQFAFLPEGLDPDDLIRQQGPAAFQAMLARTSPLFDVLMKREDEREQPATTPEQRASVEARLNALVAQIGDTGGASPIRERAARDALGQEPQAGPRDHACRWPPSLRRRPASGATIRSSTGASRPVRSRDALARPHPAAANPATLSVRSNELAERSQLLPPREVLLIRTLLNHPWLLEARCEEIAELTLTSPPLARLRDGLLDLLARNATLEREEMRAQLSSRGPGQDRWPWPSGPAHTRATGLPSPRLLRLKSRPAGAMPLPSTKPKWA